ncbi:unnamed protein product, partial [Musa hybrid cultivar]
TTAASRYSQRTSRQLIQIVRQSSFNSAGQTGGDTLKTCSCNRTRTFLREALASERLNHPGEVHGSVPTRQPKRATWGPTQQQRCSLHAHARVHLRLLLPLLLINGALVVSCSKFSSPLLRFFYSRTSLSISSAFAREEQENRERSKEKRWDGLTRVSSGMWPALGTSPPPTRRRRKRVGGKERGRRRLSSSSFLCF